MISKYKTVEIHIYAFYFYTDIFSLKKILHEVLFIFFLFPSLSLFVFPSSRKIAYMSLEGEKDYFKADKYGKQIMFSSSLL